MAELNNGVSQSPAAQDDDMMEGAPMDVDRPLDVQHADGQLDSVEQDVLQDTQLDAGGDQVTEQGAGVSEASGLETEDPEGEGVGTVSAGSTEGQGRRQSDLKHWLL